MSSIDSTPHMSGEPDYFSNIVSDYQDHIREIYFAWPGTSSGRAPLAEEEETIRQMSGELPYIKSMGINLNLLFNASCYGPDAVAKSFSTRTRELIAQLHDLLGIDAITTLSPVIAGMVQKEFPMIDVRASVNMRLGTVQGMNYTSSYFDSYYVQREFNRNPDRLAALQKWADAHGKKLYMLVNSGCLNFCSFQTFHDNVVSHESEITNDETTLQADTLCRDYYSGEGHRVNFLQGSWIRPEDIDKHRHYFSGGYKLATRMHDNPRMVIDAYTREKYYGNLLDLMEPGFGPLWHPHILNNRAFPADWFDKTITCGQQCTDCTYCQAIIEKTSVKL